MKKRFSDEQIEMIMREVDSMGTPIALISQVHKVTMRKLTEAAEFSSLEMEKAQTVVAWAWAMGEGRSGDYDSFIFEIKNSIVFLKSWIWYNLAFRD